MSNPYEVEADTKPEPHTGALIVALPAENDPVHALGPEEKHVTMNWFGAAEHIPAELMNAIANVAQTAAMVTPGFDAKINGTAQLGDDGAKVLLLESPELVALRELIMTAPPVAAAMAQVDQFPVWIPHLTCGYGEEDLPEDLPETVRIDAIGFWVGENRQTYTLTGGHTFDQVFSGGPVTDDEADDLFGPVSLKKTYVVVSAGFSFDESLHPRDRNGRFIRKFGIIKFLTHGNWGYGKVDGIYQDGSQVKVSATPSDLAGTPTGAGSIQLTPSQIYSAPKKKAHLPISHASSKKIGGQAGSNPGGLYQLDVVGTPLHLESPAGTATKKDFLDAFTDSNGNIKYGATPEKSAVLAKLAIKPGDKVDFIEDGKDSQGVKQGVVSQVSIDPTWWPNDPKNPDASLLYMVKEGGKTKSVRVTTDLNGTGRIAPEGGLTTATPSASVKYYVKTPKSKKHGQNEELANDLYVAAGVLVPTVDTGPDGNTYSEIISGKHDMAQRIQSGDKVWMEKVQRDFAVDAWLGNRDVFGLTLDNILTTDDGSETPARIDNGGALLFRAMGAPKTDFGSQVTELDAFRKGSKKKAIYGPNVMSKETELDGAQRVLAISPAQIDDMVSKNGLPKSLSDTLKARRAYIADYYGLPLPESMKPVDTDQISTTAPLVDPADLSTSKGKGRDWHGMKLSETPFIYEAGDTLYFPGADQQVTIGQDKDTGKLLNTVETQAQWMNLAQEHGFDAPVMFHKSTIADQPRPEHGASIYAGNIGNYRYQRGDKLVGSDGKKFYVLGYNKSTGAALLRKQKGEGEDKSLPFLVDTSQGGSYTMERWDPPTPQPVMPVEEKITKDKVTTDVPDVPPAVPTGLAVEASQAVKADLVTPLPDGKAQAELPVVKLDSKSGVGMVLGDGNAVEPDDDVISKVDGKTYTYVKKKGPYAVVTSQAFGDDQNKLLTKKASTLTKKGATAKEQAAVAAPKTADGKTPSVGMQAVAKDGHAGTITMISPDGKFVFITDANGKKKRKSVGTVTITDDLSGTPTGEAVDTPSTPSPNDEFKNMSDWEYSVGDQISGNGENWLTISAINGDDLTLHPEADPGYTYHFSKNDPVVVMHKPGLTPAEADASLKDLWDKIMPDANTSEPEKNTPQEDAQLQDLWNQITNNPEADKFAPLTLQETAPYTPSPGEKVLAVTDKGGEFPGYFSSMDGGATWHSINEDGSLSGMTLYEGDFIDGTGFNQTVETLFDDTPEPDAPDTTVAPALPGGYTPVPGEKTLLYGGPGGLYYTSKVPGEWQTIAENGELNPYIYDASSLDSSQIQMVYGDVNEPYPGESSTPTPGPFDMPSPVHLSDHAEFGAIEPGDTWEMDGKQVTAVGYAADGVIPVKINDNEDNVVPLYMNSIPPDAYYEISAGGTPYADATKVNEIYDNAWKTSDQIQAEKDLIGVSSGGSSSPFVSMMAKQQNVDLNSSNWVAYDGDSQTFYSIEGMLAKEWDPDAQVWKKVQGNDTPFVPSLPVVAKHNVIPDALVSFQEDGTPDVIAGYHVWSTDKVFTHSSPDGAGNIYFVQDLAGSWYEIHSDGGGNLVQISSPESSGTNVDDLTQIHPKVEPPVDIPEAPSPSKTPPWLVPNGYDPSGKQLASAGNTYNKEGDAFLFEKQGDNNWKLVHYDWETKDFTGYGTFDYTDKEVQDENPTYWNSPDPSAETVVDTAKDVADPNNPAIPPFDVPESYDVTGKTVAKMSNGGLWEKQDDGTWSKIFANGEKLDTSITDETVNTEATQIWTDPIPNENTPPPPTIDGFTPNPGDKVLSVSYPNDAPHYYVQPGGEGNWFYVANGQITDSESTQAEMDEFADAEDVTKVEVYGFDTPMGTKPAVDTAPKPPFEVPGNYDPAGKTLLDLKSKFSSSHQTYEKQDDGTWLALDTDPMTGDFTGYNVYPMDAEDANGYIGKSGAEFWVSPPLAPATTSYNGYVPSPGQKVLSMLHSSSTGGPTFYVNKSPDSDSWFEVQDDGSLGSLAISSHIFAGMEKQPDWTKEDLYGFAAPDPNPPGQFGGYQSEAGQTVAEFTGLDGKTTYFVTSPDMGDWKQVENGALGLSFDHGVVNWGISSGSGKIVQGAIPDAVNVEPKQADIPAGAKGVKKINSADAYSQNPLTNFQKTAIDNLGQLEEGQTLWVNSWGTFVKTNTGDYYQVSSSDGTVGVNPIHAGTDLSEVTFTPTGPPTVSSHTPPPFSVPDGYDPTGKTLIAVTGTDNNGKATALIFQQIPNGNYTIVDPDTGAVGSGNGITESVITSPLNSWGGITKWDGANGTSVSGPSSPPTSTNLPSFPLPDGFDPAGKDLIAAHNTNNGMDLLFEKPTGTDNYTLVGEPSPVTWTEQEIFDSENQGYYSGVKTWSSGTNTSTSTPTTPAPPSEPYIDNGELTAMAKKKIENYGPPKPNEILYVTDGGNAVYVHDPANPDDYYQLYPSGALGAHYDSSELNHQFLQEVKGIGSTPATNNTPPFDIPKDLDANGKDLIQASDDGGFIYLFQKLDDGSDNYKVAWKKSSNNDVWQTSNIQTTWSENEIKGAWTNVDTWSSSGTPAVAPTVPAVSTAPVYPGSEKPDATAVASWGGALTKDGYIPSTGMHVMGKGPMTGKIISVSKDKTKATVLTSDNKKSTRLIAALSVDKGKNYQVYAAPAFKPTMPVPSNMPIAALPPKEALKDTIETGKWNPIMHDNTKAVKSGSMFVQKALTPSGKKVARIHFVLTPQHRAALLAELAKGPDTPTAKQELGAWEQGSIQSLDVAPGQNISMRLGTSTSKWKVDASGTEPTHVVVSVSDGSDAQHKSVVLKSLADNTEITSSFKSGFTVPVFTWDANKPKPPPPVVASSAGGIKISAQSQIEGWKVTHNDWVIAGISGSKTTSMGGEIAVGADVVGTLKVEPGQVVSSNATPWNHWYNYNTKPGLRKINSDGSVIEILAPGPGVNSNYGYTVITVPDGDNADVVMQKAFEDMKMPYAPMTQEGAKAAVRGHLKQMLSLSLQDNYKGSQDSAAGDGAMFAKAGQTIGIPDIGWQDVEIGTDASGTTLYFWSPRVRDALEKKLKVGSIVRSIGSPDPDKIESTLVYGTADTAKKWVAGMPTNTTGGNGAGTDAGNLAGNGSYSSAIPKSYGTLPDKNPHWGGKTVSHSNPMNVFARIMDYRPGPPSGYGADAYGKGHGSGSNSFQIGINQGNVQDFYPGGGLPGETVGFYAVNTETERQKLIQHFHKKGRSVLGGRPIEQIILTKAQIKTKKQSDLPPVWLPPNLTPILSLPETYSVENPDATTAAVA